MSSNGPVKSGASKNNPVIRIPFSQADLGAVDALGRGGKVLADVTVQYRRNLVSQLHQAHDALRSQLAEYPGGMATMVFKLRETGIAKSHRPNKILREAGLFHAGHDNIDEMLVGVNATTISRLESVITHREIKAVVANLSAIEQITAWDLSRKIPDGIDTLLTSPRVMVRLFDYVASDAGNQNYSSVIRLLMTTGTAFQQIEQMRGSPVLQLSCVTQKDKELIQTLAAHPGVRTMTPEPVYSSVPVDASAMPALEAETLPVPQSGLPTIAVFDTGVSPAANAIKPWIVSRDTYTVPPDTRYEHGTMVASLVSGARFFNGAHQVLPDASCLIHDVCALEEDKSYVSDLELRLAEALKKRPDIKIWNLSLGGKICHPEKFSDFAMTLDRLSDEFGVLFVVAAGNYKDLPRRAWPNPVQLNGADLITSPGEAVRVLTVGSVAHLQATGSLESAGMPASYTRRGPGPVFTPKPDVIHAGGGVHAPWAAGPGSINVLWPDNCLRPSFGTSFASPLVAGIAAHTWQKIATSPDFSVSPSLVKGLVIHSAQLSSPAYTALERRYFGSGRPQEVAETLYDADDRFTLIFQTQLLPGMRWRKDNYPMPASLIQNGKFSGEIIITAVYSPPLDPRAGSEYVRANVELSFGTIVNNTMKGKVPMEGEDGQSGYESAQIEFGGKWSPVKIHRKSFPKGTESGNWAIQAKAVLRANEPALEEPLPVTIIVTVRSLEGNTNVYADGIRALSAANWVNLPLPVPSLSLSV